MSPGLAISAVGGWLAGVALQLQQAGLWPRSTLSAVAAGGVVAAALWWPARRRGTARWLLLPACVALGFASTAWRAQQRLDDRLQPVLEGADIRVTGTVAGLPQASAGGTRFVLQTESATLAGEAVRVPELVSLGWWRSADEGELGDLLSAPAEPLAAGQRWQMTVRLRQPHGGFNPHGFDFELWLFERGVGATGSVRARPGNPPVKLADGAAHPVERFRQHVKDAIERRVADPAAAGVLAALAVGDQAAIDRAGWALYRDTGVAHLMSISGLHVTMFAWLAAALVGRLWRLHPRLPLLCATPQAARWGGLAAAFGYALLAGWGVPAQRTVWMIAVVAALRSSGLRWPLPGVLLLAALAVTLADPWALLQPGFWLSFGAVALLVAAEPAPAPAAGAAWRARTAALLKSGLRTQLVATVGLAPLSLLFFQQFSLVGFAANLVAIPLVTLLVTPLALLGMLLPPLWLAAAALVQALSSLLQQLAAVPWAMWTSAAAPPWAAACGLLAGALAVLPLPWRLRAMALPLALPLLLPPLPRPADGRFELVAADVGQGTAVLVRTRQHLLLYDTGPAYSPESDAGQRVLLPLLRARGERRIDALVVSHRDSDHAGGAAAVIAGLPVRLLRTSLDPGHPLLQAGIAHRRCDAGQGWQWDGVRFDVLHPPQADHAAAAKPNAVSCVLRITGSAPGQPSVLLAGDVEAVQEAALVQRDRAAADTGAAPALRADVLLVPHHGSRTSSTAGFIAAVQPRVAVVQAAYRSRFGHPAPDVVARYEAAGATVVRSDACGAWTLNAAEAALPGVCERSRARRYWHHRAASLLPPG